MANRLINLRSEIQGNMGDVKEQIKRKWKILEGNVEVNKEEENGIQKK